jgi:hypothetical protein
MNIQGAVFTHPLEPPRGPGVDIEPLFTQSEALEGVVCEPLREGRAALRVSEFSILDTKVSKFS